MEWLKQSHTDTEVIILNYLDKKRDSAKSKEELIDDTAKEMLPIGGDLLYWKNKVKEVLERHKID